MCRQGYLSIFVRMRATRDKDVQGFCTPDTGHIWVTFFMRIKYKFQNKSSRHAVAEIQPIYKIACSSGMRTVNENPFPNHRETFWFPNKTLLYGKTFSGMDTCALLHGDRDPNTAGCWVLRGHDWALWTPWFSLHGKRACSVSFCQGAVWMHSYRTQPSSQTVKSLCLFSAKNVLSPLSIY